MFQITEKAIVLLKLQELVTELVTGLVTLQTAAEESAKVEDQERAAKLLEHANKIVPSFREYGAEECWVSVECLLSGEDDIDDSLWGEQEYGSYKDDLPVWPVMQILLLIAPSIKASSLIKSVNSYLQIAENLSRSTVPTMKLLSELYAILQQNATAEEIEAANNET